MSVKPKRIVHVKPDIAAKRIENLTEVYNKQITRYTALADKHNSKGNNIRETWYRNLVGALQAELGLRIADIKARTIVPAPV